MADDETTTEVEETTDDASTTDDTTGETTDDTSTADVDWKGQSRKHERRAKQEAKRAADLEAQLKQRETADLSEQEKAIAKAREDAKAEVLTEVEKERRHDRLELSVTKAAAKTFADPDDALIQIERALSRGDLDADDIFDTDGKVQTSALQSALDDLLERKPHLAAREPGPGQNDAGKGSGRGKDLEAMSVGDHLAAIRRTK